ncbi:MAG TPA: hypothetical protein VIA62_16225 [Thermoanaerobaculia bacterium]|jgi:hypothetical protein|nr:hypothetical protein [Thermoanaerobaculia bacterium]
MFLKQIFLVLRTLLTVVGMVVSLLWRFRYVTILIVGAGIALYLWGMKP